MVTRRAPAPTGLPALTDEDSMAIVSGEEASRWNHPEHEKNLYPYRRQFGLLVLLLLLTVFLAVSLLPSAERRSCHVAMPRVISHRGFDSSSSDRVASIGTIEGLIRAGVRSFDVDLYWTLDANAGLFIGHPPSLIALWGLTLPLSGIPLASLKAQPGVTLLPLEALLAHMKLSLESVDQVSLELKETEHPLWQEQLRQLYRQITVSGLAHKLAIVAGTSEQAAIHKREQLRAGTHVALLGLVRDIDAPHRRLDGSLFANLSGVYDEGLSHGVTYDGWSVSAKLLDAQLVSGAGGKPVSLWVVDDEQTLQSASDNYVESIITNKPLWARETLASWRERAGC
mmetsp:Transcript_36529/g.60501  ORF Transcript_36529/g.60501 Transcript_36529/m.60501 type:complete len:341 (+) Transcript_36529:105-1127(+)